MCLSTPDIPKPIPPQELKQPDSLGTQRRRKPTGAGPNTMLTGPSGVASGSLNTGGNTLLGG
jgi:hypothetical protein